MENPTKVEPKTSEPADDSNVTEVKKVPWSPLAAVLYAAFIYFTAQFLASLIISKSSLRTIGWRGLRWRDVVFALAGFALYFVGYAVVLTIATHIFPAINVDQKQELGFQDTSGNINLFLTFLSLVVLPPIVEETVFRGFVFSGLKNKLPFIYAAIATSLLFASAHLQYGSGKPLLWIAAIDTFTLSLVLCYLRQKTGGLWAGIFLHALKNGIAFVSLFLLHAH